MRFFSLLGIAVTACALSLIIVWFADTRFVPERIEPVRIVGKYVNPMRVQNSGNGTLIVFPAEYWVKCSNGMPLNLSALLKAEDGTFGHDIFGIRRYLDRSTGKLTSCFVPRCAL